MHQCKEQLLGYNATSTGIQCPHVWLHSPPRVYKVWLESFHDLPWKTPSMRLWSFGFFVTITSSVRVHQSGSMGLHGLGLFGIGQSVIAKSPQLLQISESVLCLLVSKWDAREVHESRQKWTSDRSMFLWAFVLDISLPWAISSKGTYMWLDLSVWITGVELSDISCRGCLITLKAIRRSWHGAFVSWSL